MREVAVETEDRLGALLDMIERGEAVRITRAGRPVARLVPEQPPAPEQIAAAREAAQRIIERRKGVTLGPDLTVKDLVENGRR